MRLYVLPVVLGGALSSGVGTLYYKSHYPVDLKSVSRDLGQRISESEYCGTEQVVVGTVEETDPEAKYYFVGDGTAVLKVIYDGAPPVAGESVKAKGTLLCYTNDAADSVVAALELSEASRSH